MQGSSELPGFYNLSREARLKILKERTGLSDEEIETISETGGLPVDVAEKMIENVVGGMTLPLGIATNFLINGRNFLIPMSVEETSVIAAASNAAKMARVKGGFSVTNTGPFMIGQVQVVNVQDPHKAKADLMLHKEELLKLANDQHPHLVSLGGGAEDLNLKIISSIRGPMLIAELIVNTVDAMGANIVDTMAEAVAPLVEQFSGGNIYLRIVSNLADKRLVRATAVFDKYFVGGEDVVDGILCAFAFADADPYRCATHNKGIMNGVDAVGMACGQDIRALEAGAHAYAARSGAYKPLTTWEKNSDSDLVGTLEMPMAVGLIGGVSRVHPTAKASIKILGVNSASELANVMAAVGLAQNLAALRVLVSEGLQMGHMKLHARNLALSGGAEGEMVDIVAKRMVIEKKITMDRAKEILDEIKKQPKAE